MEKPSSILQAMIVSLAGITVLYSVMFGSLFAQIPPHPPARVGLFMAVCLSLAVVSILLVWWRNRVGFISSILVGILSLLSFGPHKFLIYESAIKVFPVIILGTTFCIVLIISPILALRGKN